MQFFHNELYFVPLGGAGEIGMNLNAYGYNDQWVIVDCGITFGNELGIEVIIPDITFFKDKNVLGIIATHGHEDHIGAIPYLWPQLKAPVYATPFTASLIRRKLREAGVDEKNVQSVALNSQLTLGNFTFNFINITHSIPEANVLAIETPQGVIVHTGDWKFDANPLVGEVTRSEALKHWGEKGVLALIGDSTNALEEGWSGSEKEVQDTLTSLIKQQPHRVAVTCFSSNIARLEVCALAAEESGRKAVLVGRSLQKMYESAKEVGYLKKIPPFLYEADLARLPREKTLIICTGSQGESRSALSRIAYDSHPLASLEAGDTVFFSSRSIPGNEKDIGLIHNQLIRRGIKVVTPHELPIHVSGHPCKGELRQMYEWTKPLIALPVHGERRHMQAHADLAQGCGVPHTYLAEDGDILKLSREKGVEPVGQLDIYPSTLDGTLLVSLNDVAFRERRKLMYSGIIMATLQLSRQDTLKEVRLTLQGICNATPELQSRLERAIYSTFERLEEDDPFPSLNIIEEQIRVGIRREIFARTGKKPMVVVHAVREPKK